MERGKKKRERALLPKIKELITERALLDSRPREELADDLIVEIKNKYTQRVPPAWETVIKLISAARNHAPSPLDKPWHLGLMVNPVYNFDSEAIPDILAVQEWGEHEHPEVIFFQKSPITIRQALWVNRLHGMANLLREGKSRGMNKELDIIRWLWEWSKVYAQHETICNLSGTMFDTSELDKGLWQGALPVTADKSWSLFYRDRSFIVDSHTFKKYQEGKKESES